MRGKVAATGWLVVVWVALWGSLTVANVVGGVLAAAFVLGLTPPAPSTVSLIRRPVAMARLVVYFLWELVKASAMVAWEVITPWDATAPAVVAVRLETADPHVLVAVANMVSLTPGTLTIDVDPESGTLYVHVLHFHSEGRVLGGIRALERLSAAAYGAEGRAA